MDNVNTQFGSSESDLGLKKISTDITRKSWDHVYGKWKYNVPKSTQKLF